MNNSLCRTERASSITKRGRGSSWGLIHRQGSNENSAAAILKRSKRREGFGPGGRTVSDFAWNPTRRVSDAWLWHCKVADFPEWGSQFYDDVIFVAKSKQPRNDCQLWFFRGAIKRFLHQKTKEEEHFRILPAAKQTGHDWCKASCFKFLMFNR